MSQSKELDVNSLIGGIQDTKDLTVKTKITNIHTKALKKNKRVTRGRAVKVIKDSVFTANIIKDNTIKTNVINGKALSLNQIASTRPQKELLQNILRKHNIDENAVAEALITLKDDPDYRARESFIDRSVRFLGYNYADKEQQSTTNNTVVYMPDILIKKYKRDSNINQIIEEGDLIAE